MKTHCFKSILRMLFLLCMGSAFTAQSATLMVQIDFVNEEFTVAKAWVIEKNYSASNVSAPLEDDLILRLLDEKNKLLHAARVRNPKVVRSPLIPPDGLNSAIQGSEHSYHKLLTGSVVVRFPYQKNIRYVELQESQVEVAGASRRNLLNSRRIKLDLLNRLH